jgi:farnesyl-diphosphate farnesyltransferase
MSDHQELQHLLDKTSRTFALSIPLLPEPTRSEVSVAYLLFRILDTLEDATDWSAVERIQALDEFRDLLSTGDDALARGIAARWGEAPPLQHAGYLELLAAMPRVLNAYRELGSDAAREHICRYATQSAEGMIAFIGRTDSDGTLRLDSLRDLRDYCFVVAGVVGELLTELFLLGRPELAPVARELRRRALPFGEGLQLVNILKDVSADAKVGRVYLPRQVPLAQVFALAGADLQAAAEYNEALRTSGAPRGIWAFNALNAGLASASLKRLEKSGPGSKLSRLEVSRLHAQVLQAAERGAALSGASVT